MPNVVYLPQPLTLSALRTFDALHGKGAIAAVFFAPVKSLVQARAQEHQQRYQEGSPQEYSCVTD